MMRKLSLDKPSAVALKVEYDVEAQVMRVTFTNGTVSEASGVPANVATEIEQPGASFGKIWHAKLKHYTWTNL